MVNKQRYIILGVLLAITLIFSAALPFYLSRNPRATPAAGEAPRPTSTLFRTPAVKVGDVVEASNGQAELPLSNTNCTYPVQYWQTRPETWPAQVILGGTTYQKEEINVLMLDPAPSVQVQLMQQMFSALMNVIYGSNVTAIENVMVEADQWLQANPTDSTLSEFTRRQGLYQARLLELYNLGEIGPGPCEDTDAMIAVTGAGTPAAVTPTGAVQSALPTLTPSPLRVIELPQPSPTEEEQEEPAPLPSPTEPPPPSPTEPPPPLPSPTVPPPPTATSAPEPQPTPTQVPEESKHPQGVALADTYGVTYDEIMSWHNQGFGFGDIDKAYDLSQDTGTPVSQIFSLLSQGLGWGEIRDRLSGDDDDDDDDDD